MYDKFKHELPYRLLDTSKYPPEVAGRFNSFITTQFDDSLSVEMQMRSIIKWATDNFKLMDSEYNDFTDYIINENINPFIVFLNDLIEYMNEFIETFDEKYQETILDKMQEWYDNGELESLINESLDTKYHEMDDRFTAQLAQTNEHVKQHGINIKTSPYFAKGNANYKNPSDGKYYVDKDYTTLADDDTEIIQRVIDEAPSGSSVYIPDGNYRHTGLVINKPLFIRGSSRTKALLINDSLNDGITIQNASFWGLENIQVRGNGANDGSLGTDATSGHGIVLDNAHESYISNVWVMRNGGNGLHIKKSYTMMIQNCKFEQNKLDGVNAIGDWGSQINSIRFDHCRSGNNNRSGYNIWGVSISILSGTCEGNKEYGIEVNSANKETDSSCTSLELKGIYMEQNIKGSLYFNPTLSSPIIGLSMDGLYIYHQNEQIPEMSDNAVILTPQTIRAYRKIRWGVNFVTQQRENVGSVDFGGSLRSDSVIHTPHPIEQIGNNRYLNMGGATKLGVKKKVINGFFEQNGGDVVYSSYKDKSDDIPKSASSSGGGYAYFPLDVADGDWLREIGITIHTDSDRYTVNLRVLECDDDGNEVHVLDSPLSNASGNSEHSTILDKVFSSDFKYVIAVKVTTYSDTNQTYMNLGSPYILTNS